MQVPNDVKEKFKDTTNALKESLTEVRALSKSLNNEVVLNQGFHKSIENELNRLKKMKFDAAELKIMGDVVPFQDKKHEIIMFRIIQEFLSNSVKYSEAKTLNINLSYSNKSLQIEAMDDGIGFKMEDIEQGSGLINMKSRATLIGATLQLQSEPGKGVNLKIDYPLY